jgi:hypothetical protein
VDEEEKDLICSVGAYSAVLTYASSLRGNMGFFFDLFGLRTHIDKGKHDPTHPHVVVTLLGRLKGEEGERYHVKPHLASRCENGWNVWLPCMRDKAIFMVQPLTMAKAWGRKPGLSI